MRTEICSRVFILCCYCAITFEFFFIFFFGTCECVVSRKYLRFSILHFRDNRHFHPNFFIFHFYFHLFDEFFFIFHVYSIIMSYSICVILIKLKWNDCQVIIYEAIQMLLWISCDFVFVSNTFYFCLVSILIYDILCTINSMLLSLPQQILEFSFEPN